MTLSTRVLPSILEVAADDWDRISGPEAFTRHGWLAALEVSGAAGPDRDWRPAHVCLFDDDALVAACPTYVREQTYGEFVWDGPVERACLTSDIPYAPRAVATVPWAPTQGRRLLTGDERRAELLPRLADAVLQVASERGWRSVGVHFCDSDEAAAFRTVGFIGRLGWQYLWQDRGYASFDDFLGSLKRKRRVAMRRELDELSRQGIELTLRRGDPEDFARMGALYEDTWTRHTEGPPALPLRFFEELGARDADAIHFGVATRGDEVIAMTLNALTDDALLGRYWGCTERLRFLHFNLTYHLPVRWCLERGLSSCDPGQGGEYKRVRGYDPTLTRSVHWYADPRLHAAVTRWAQQERSWVLGRLEEERALGPYRAPG